MFDTLRKRTRGKRITILGVGNPLRGDDGIGSALVDCLQGYYIDATLINAGDVPENYLDVVRDARPDVVLIIDAVELGTRPGDVALIEIEQLGGVLATTHNTSLAPLAKMIRAETHADVVLVAIQPGTHEFGAPMSPQVQATLASLERLFRDLQEA